MQEQHKLLTQADKNYGEVIMYQTDDGQTQLDVRLENDTIWLTANQMALLFGRDEKTIRKHINNVFLDGELVQMNNTHFLRVVGVKQPVAFYTLVALTIMIAESRSEEKEMMISVIMNCLG